MSLASRLADLVAIIGYDIGDLNDRMTTVEAARVPVGTPIPWLTKNIPAGHLEFNGQAITNAAQPALFALFGANLPDLRDRFLMGVSATHPDGEVGGLDTVTLTGAQTGVPAHGHADTLAVSNSNIGQTAGWNIPTGNSSWSRGLVTASGAVGVAKNDGTLGSYASGTHSHPLTGGVTNHPGTAATAHENKPPYRTVRWITREA